MEGLNLQSNNEYHKNHSSFFDIPKNEIDKGMKKYLELISINNYSDDRKQKIKNDYNEIITLMENDKKEFFAKVQKIEDNLTLTELQKNDTVKNYIVELQESLKQKSLRFIQKCNEFEETIKNNQTRYN